MELVWESTLTRMTRSCTCGESCLQTNPSLPEPSLIHHHHLLRPHMPPVHPQLPTSYLYPSAHFLAPTSPSPSPSATFHPAGPPHRLYPTLPAGRPAHICHQPTPSICPSRPSRFFAADGANSSLCSAPAAAPAVSSPSPPPTNALVPDGLCICCADSWRGRLCPPPPGDHRSCFPLIAHSSYS